MKKPEAFSMSSSLSLLSSLESRLMIKRKVFLFGFRVYVSDLYTRGCEIMEDDDDKMKMIFPYFFLFFIFLIII